MSNIESNLKKLLRGEKACIPEHFLKVPAYNSPTLRTGKGMTLSEGKFGKTYRGSINDNGRRYVAYKEIDTSKSVPGAFEFEFKVAQKLKEFAVPEVYLFKKCPIQNKTPQKIRDDGRVITPTRRTKPKDIIYMELLNGMSFNSWWKTNPSLGAIKSVIVQVFNNLYRINQKYPDFRHRDLHGGNVMVNPKDLTTQYTWKVDTGGPNIKQYKRTNAGVTAHIIDFGLSYWSSRMPNPETADGGYEYVGIYKDRPGTIYYDIHKFLYAIYRKVKYPADGKEREIKNFIDQLIPDKEFLEFNGKYTVDGSLLTPPRPNLLKQYLPSFKTILTHPFLTDADRPNGSKTLDETLKMIAPKPKPKTKPKTLPNVKTKTPSAKPSTAERKEKIKRIAAILAANKAKSKAGPARRRTGPVPKIQTVAPKAKTPTPKKEVNRYINKFVNKLDKDGVNALKKKICQP